MNDPARESVWLALSELWLDTELDAADLAAIAGTLAISGLTVEELEAIYRLEVAPVVWSNAWTTAGVWDGFDPAWLSAAIAAHRARAWRWPDRWCWRGYARAQWRWLGPRVAALRAEAAAT